MAERSIFDEYVSSETNVDILKMNSITAILNKYVAKFKAAKKPNAEAIEELSYVETYIARCQSTIKLDQDINRKLATNNTALQEKVLKLEGEVKQVNETNKMLLEQWNKE